MDRRGISLCLSAIVSGALLTLSATGALALAAPPVSAPTSSSQVAAPAEPKPEQPALPEGTEPSAADPQVTPASAQAPPRPSGSTAAQVPATQEPPPTGEPRLVIHGFLNQAFGRSGKHQILGIPTQGTFDYRTLAIQFRYAITGSDTMVIQLANKRLGASPFMQIQPDVAVGWAFYEHKFADGTAVRVGKVQIPLGIYNEIRYVGTLLPFYRPPFGFYQEGAFMSETVNGVVANRMFDLGNWTLDASVYGGGWEWADNGLSASPVVMRADVRNGFGTQLWLETPVTGLRLGLGGHRGTVSGGVIWVDGSDNFTSWNASLDGSFERFTIRGEYRVIDLGPYLSPPTPGYFDGSKVEAYYGQVGLKLTEKLTANVQADLVNIEVTNAYGFPGVLQRDMNRDYAVGLNYAFHPWLVLKGEYHRTKGFWIEDEPIFIWGEPVEANYSIVSLAVSF